MVKRPYLRTDDRRRQLLEATSRLLARDGLLGITMVAVAAEAGVSRRLVYDHFADLTSLFEAFFEDRANRYLVAIDRAILNSEGPAAGLTGSYAELLAMPVEDQQAIRLLVAGPGLPELEPVRVRFREHIEQRWLPRLPIADNEIARAMLWTLVSGVLGMAELVARGDLAQTAALELARSLAMSMPDALTTSSADSSALRRMNTPT
jgi:AcrR family transcriptional regulator